MSEQAYQSALKELFTAIERLVEKLNNPSIIDNRVAISYSLGVLLSVFGRINLDLAELRDFRRKLIQLRDNSSSSVDEMLRDHLIDRWRA